MTDATERRETLVSAALDSYLDAAITRASVHGPRYVALWDSLRTSTRGGKRLRPGLVMASYESLGGTDLAAAAEVAAAFEFLHTALILHDDVIDRDFVRRGAPNLSGEFRDVAQTAGIPLPIAEHRGSSAGVIAGDLALAACFAMLDPARMSPTTYDRVRAVVDDALFRSAAGELLDVDFSLFADTPTVEEVLDMERLKTAVYSFEAPLSAGALLAGADDGAIEALAGFGREIGIAYQIIDDILGLFGDEAVTGKSTIGDLREGKCTVIIAYAARTPSWPAVSRFLGRRDLTESQAGFVRKSLENAGARTFAEGLARQCANTAWSYLASPALPDAVRDEFRENVRAVLERVR